jgi:hypothetical protein
MWFPFYPASENKQQVAGSASTHPAVFIAVIPRTNDSVEESNPAQMARGVIIVLIVDILQVLY